MSDLENLIINPKSIDVATSSPDIAAQTNPETGEYTLEKTALGEILIPKLQGIRPTQEYKLSASFGMYYNTPENLSLYRSLNRTTAYVFFMLREQMFYYNYIVIAHNEMADCLGIGKRTLGVCLTELKKAKLIHAIKLSASEMREFKNLYQRVFGREYPKHASLYQIDLSTGWRGAAKFIPEAPKGFSFISRGKFWQEFMDKFSSYFLTPIAALHELRERGKYIESIIKKKWADWKKQ